MTDFINQIDNIKIDDNLYNTIKDEFLTCIMKSYIGIKYDLEYGIPIKKYEKFTKPKKFDSQYEHMLKEEDEKIKKCIKIAIVNNPSIDITSIYGAVLFYYITTSIADGDHGMEHDCVILKKIKEKKDYFYIYHTIITSNLRWASKIRRICLGMKSKSKSKSKGGTKKKTRRNRRKSVRRNRRD